MSEPDLQGTPASPSSPTEPALWNRRFVFLLIAQAGFGFAHSSFLMLPKFLATELDAGPDEIGLVVAASAISIVFFLVPAGAMVDRYGRKIFLVSGATLMAMTCAAHVYVEEIGAPLYALRALQSLAFAYAYAAGAALAIDAAPPSRIGQAIGLFGLCYVFMGAFAPAAVEAIVEVRGWDSAFSMSAFAAFFCAVLSLFINESPPAAAPGERKGMLAVLRQPSMRSGIIVTGLLGVAFGCAFNFYQPFALSLGIDQLRDFFIANSIASAGVRLGIGPYVDRIGLRRVSLVSLALYSGVIFAMIWLDSIGLLLLGIGMGTAHGLFFPSYSGLILQGSPSDERGRRLATIQGALNLGMGAGGIVLGFIAARFGYPAIFGLSSGALALAWIVILYENPEASASLTRPKAAPAKRAGL
jgi:MFS family permease